VQLKTCALDVFWMPMHPELLGANGYWAFWGDDNGYWALTGVNDGWALTCADGYWAFWGDDTQYWALTGANRYWVFWGVPMKIGLFEGMTMDIGLWISMEVNLGWCQWILGFGWKKLLLEDLETLKHKYDAGCMTDMLGCALMDAVWCWCDACKMHDLNAWNVVIDGCNV
jgi:hypothetical protein